MATRSDLRVLAQIRIKAAVALIDIKDWDYAGYTLGSALEIALKAAICKKLGLNEYPADDSAQDSDVKKVFRSHNFGLLLMLAGLVRDTRPGGDPEFSFAWSDATKKYMAPTAKGSWVDMRYKIGYWDEPSVSQVISALCDKKSGILQYLTRKRKW